MARRTASASSWKGSTVSTGPPKYFTKRNKGLHGPFMLAGDLKSTVNSGLPIVKVNGDFGIKSDGEPKVSGLSPQAAYTPIVQDMKAKGSTYAQNLVDYKADVFLRKEAQTQGVNTVKVWDCALQCYDQRLLQEGGAREAAEPVVAVDHHQRPGWRPDLLHAPG